MIPIPMSVKKGKERWEKRQMKQRMVGWREIFGSLLLFILIMGFKIDKGAITI